MKKHMEDIKKTNFFDSKAEKNYEAPKKNEEFVFSFNNGRDERGFSLLNDKILSSDKYFNLK